MTKIQQWQVDRGFESHPLYYMWIRILHNECVQQFKWVTDLTSIGSSSDAWERYYRDLTTSLPYDDNCIISIPNTDTKRIWEHRADALKLFLVNYYHVLQYVSIDPIISDVYREKVDQAVNYLSGTINYIPLFLVNPNKSKKDIEYAEKEANDIIRKRADWVSATSKLEYIRRGYLSILMNEDSVEKIHELTKNRIQILMQMRFD